MITSFPKSYCAIVVTVQVAPSHRPPQNTKHKRKAQHISCKVRAVLIRCPCRRNCIQGSESQELHFSLSVITSDIEKELSKTFQTFFQ
jgi:hypothetical protein